MRYNFAKVFTFYAHQVLITKVDDPEESEYQVSMEFRLDNGAGSTMSIGFKNEKDRDKFFDSYDREDADEFLRSSLKLVE